MCGNVSNMLESGLFYTCEYSKDLCREILYDQYDTIQGRSRPRTVSPGSRSYDAVAPSPRLYHTIWYTKHMNTQKNTISALQNAEMARQPAARRQNGEAPVGTTRPASPVFAHKTSVVPSRHIPHLCAFMRTKTHFLTAKGVGHRRAVRVKNEGRGVCAGGSRLGLAAPLP